MKPMLTQFAYWNEEDGFWNQFSSLEDAASEAGDGARIYKMTASPIGRFKRSVVLLKVRQRRGKTIKARRSA